MADRFYTNSPLAVGPALLQGAEAHHLVSVMRYRPGDRVRLFNGDGREYPAEILEADRKRVALQVLGVESPVRELGFRLEVAAALPRGDRAEFLIEKLTELGATDFVPLLTRRGVVRAKDSTAEKLQRLAIESSKQCGRNVLLRVHPPADWGDYCRRDGLPSARYVAHPAAPDVPPSHGPDGVAVAVGPEGGFADEEVAAAESAGWRLIGLGPRVLRVETAALALAVRAAYSG
jgi:16S rRNA (uracil1498-N3)-methyltransferase